MHIWNEVLCIAHTCMLQAPGVGHTNTFNAERIDSSGLALTLTRTPHVIGGTGLVISHGPFPLAMLNT